MFIPGVFFTPVRRHHARRVRRRDVLAGTGSGSRCRRSTRSRRTGCRRPGCACGGCRGCCQSRWRRSRRAEPRLRRLELRLQEQAELQRALVGRLDLDRGWAGGTNGPTERRRRAAAAPSARAAALRGGRRSPTGGGGGGGASGGAASGGGVCATAAPEINIANKVIVVRTRCMWSPSVGPAFTVLGFAEQKLPANRSRRSER